MPPPTPQPAPPARPEQPGVDHTTDARGRVLAVGTIGPRQRLLLFKAIGPVNSKNDPYVGTVSLAYAVISIDGDPVSRPMNEIQVEALVERLGDDGIDAVAKVMLGRLGVTDDDIAAAGGDAQAAAQVAAERKRKETIEAGKP
jgi:hypothetical protein